MKPREAAFRVVYDVLYKEGYSTIVLENIRNRNDISGLDSSFMTTIAMGTLRNSIYLEKVIAQFSDIKLKKISPSVMTALKTGIYQLLFMDRVPDSAACNETVKIAGKFGGNRSRGFVNALMRNIAKNKSGISAVSGVTDELERLSIQYSFSIEAVHDMARVHGTDQTEVIMKALNEPPSLCIRKNTDADIEGVMNEEGIDFEKGLHSQNSYYITPGKDLAGTALFREGSAAVQDEGAQEMVEFLNPMKGEKVLDTCAAPGGKTAYINFLIKGKPAVTAYDIDAGRIRRMRENLERLGASNVRTEQRDMTKHEAEAEEKYDALLLDVPCSGLGTAQRRPEIKLRYKGGNSDLYRIQSNILDNSIGYLKKGGRIVYGTCTLVDEENGGIIRQFIEKHPEFIMNKEKTILPDGKRGGFYMAELVRHES